MAILTESINYTQLKNRSVIITGGASDLVEATTKLFTERGAYVTIVDMAVEMGQKACLRPGFEGPEASVKAFKHAINFSPEGTLDIALLFASTDGARTSLVDEVLREPESSLEDNPIEPKHNAVDANLVGECLSTSLALHYFRLPGGASRKNSLILVSSITGYTDLPYNTDYSVSEYGIRGLFRSIRSQAHRVNARVNNLVPGNILTPLTKKVRQIEHLDEPSKATGFVLPWAPIEYVVEACARCAVDDSLDGRALVVMPSVVIDIDEDVEIGYGGQRWVKILEKDGFMDIPSLFPKK